MLEVRLRKVFPTPQNETGFTLDVAFQSSVQTTVLFGPSGSGKTLTLDCLAGFVRPDSGYIRVQDAVLFDSVQRISLAPRQRRCGYVFQNYALFPHMTVHENLAFALPSRSPEREPRIQEMLARFRLTELAMRRPHQLSGGQQQRCSIARALINTPHLLLLDEPTRGLDALLREELYDTLKQVQREFATPVLLVTHDWGECRALGELAVLLQSGQVAQIGKINEVWSTPANETIRHLLGKF